MRPRRTRVSAVCCSPRSALWSTCVVLVCAGMIHDTATHALFRSLLPLHARAYARVTPPPPAYCLAPRTPDLRRLDTVAKASEPIPIISCGGHLSKSTLVRDVSRDLGQHAVVGRVRLHVVQCPARQLGIVRQH
eukprot:Tamp_30762.p1 GENE.Tamp_30762~~Tamp_30762.p1  ORF type:complete len:134 (+),score=3.70 Tamp_30762:206-607(+)